jgi:hypothetical protein
MGIESLVNQLKVNIRSFLQCLRKDNRKHNKNFWQVRKITKLGYLLR